MSLTLLYAFSFALDNIVLSIHNVICCPAIFNLNLTHSRVFILCRMSDMEINIRFNHAGEFKSKNYVGGMCMVVSRVEVDTFSYTVLMEYVRDYLHYTEIGGVYSKMTKGGWQLISNDKDLMDIVAGCKHGEEIDLYVDNTVDKDIEPLNQMQPHVTVRPRNNLVQGRCIFTIMVHMR